MTSVPDLTGFHHIEKAESSLMSRNTIPQVSVREKAISLSAEAIRQLGRPRKVYVLFNPNTQQVAIYPAAITDEKAYSVGYGGGTISCVRLLQEVAPQIGKYTAQIIDGVLFFSVIKKPTQRVRVGGWK